MRGIGPLAAARLDQPMVAAPREQRVEEQILRSASQQAGAKFTEDGGIESRVRELQA